MMIAGQLVFEAMFLPGGADSYYGRFMACPGGCRYEIRNLRTGVEASGPLCLHLPDQNTALAVHEAWLREMWDEVRDRFAGDDPPWRVLMLSWECAMTMTGALRHSRSHRRAARAACARVARWLAIVDLGMMPPGLSIGEARRLIHVPSGGRVLHTDVTDYGHTYTMTIVGCAERPRTLHRAIVVYGRGERSGT